MSILDPSYMIDLGGIDVIQSQGVAIPGLYQKLLDNIGPCGNPLIYNWKFNGVFIPPQFVEPILEDDAIYINDIYVSSDDVVHIPSIERPPVTVQLNVSENGEYEAPEGVDGYNPVSVDVQPNIVQLNVSENGTYEVSEGVDGYNPVVVNVAGILTGRDTPSASLGSDGDVYKQVIPIPTNINFVEYLQSSGTQYINTGIIGNQDTGYLYDQETTIAAWGFGARASAQSRAVVITSDGPSTTINTFDLGTERKTIGSIPARRTMLLKDRKLYINGVLKAMYGMPTGFTTPNPLLLFGTYNGSSVALTNGGFKLYRAVIYDGIIPIADYLPCIDGNGVACMWDNIAQEYAYNDGTGDFTSGTAVTPDPLNDVYYVKENGEWKLINS